MNTPSTQFNQEVSIKSKYLNFNEERILVIDPLAFQISISQSGNPYRFKRFAIDELEATKAMGHNIQMKFQNGRTYDIQTLNPQKLVKTLRMTQNIQKTNKFAQQSIDVKPAEVNYQASYLQPQDLNQSESSRQISKKVSTGVKESPNTSSSQTSPSPDKLKTIYKSKQREEEKKKAHIPLYRQQSYFHRAQDWEFKAKHGNLVVKNPEWLGNTSKIFSFVLKKFLSTGSFGGISFPVFAMKPESILETYAKSLGSASAILTKTDDNLERMKQFQCVLWTLSLLQVTIVKQFNPTMGQTFQADINGGRFSSQQVSHHPPVSAFYYEKDDYKIYAGLQLDASVGVNSGDGRFIGDITIQYDDGYWCKGKLPNGKITGVLIGTTTFEPYGGSYVYDSEKRVLTYQLASHSNFQGYIGLLNAKAQKQFQARLKTKERFVEFTAFPKSQYSRIESQFKARYTQWVSFDNQEYINLSDRRIMPYEILEPFDELLPSDSRHRIDIKQLRNGNQDKAQDEKEQIENEERQWRKLREKYQKKK